MKKITTIFFLTLIVSRFMAYAGDVIVLDLSNPTNPTEFELDSAKGYWVETYNTDEKFRQIEFDLFRFTHIPTGFGGTDVGDGMSYWDGFTYCTNGDTNDYGVWGSSDGWVAQQWGCMAGGGIKTDGDGNVLTDPTGKVQVEKGIPYLVAYWGYWVETVENGAPCLQVNFANDKLYEPVGMYVNNHPWPYYGNIHGDGFASPFTDDGDSFKLIIHGFNEYKEDIGVEIEYILAEFKDGELHQSPDWEWIDLSALGAVSGIYFTMESTDMHNIVELGPNTAVYFCMDKLTLIDPEESTKPSRPTGLNAVSDETTIDITWKESESSIGVIGYNLYLNGGEKIFTENTAHTFTELSPYTEYKIEVEAISTDNSLSPKASVTIQTKDVTPPTMPQNLQGTATFNSIALTWEASTDNVAATEYHVYMDGERQKRVYETNYILTGLDPATSYFIEVEARDAAGNRSEKASATIVTEEKGNSLQSFSETVDIYFYPMTQTLYLESTENTLVEIFDMAGGLVLSQKMPSGKNQVALHHLSQGVYIVKYGNKILKINK